MPIKLNTKEFIEKVINIHKNRYNYDKVNYINSKTKVIITCQQHGDFLQTPDNHINSAHGCPSCALNVNKLRSLNSKSTLENFIFKAKNVHGNRYDYSLSHLNYDCATSKVIIICQKHGQFIQKASNHLQEQHCPNCSMEIRKNCQRHTNEIFIEMAIKIYGEKYNYTNVNYINNGTKIEIICDSHGTFYPTPNNHLRGSECPVCGKGSSVKNICKQLKNKNINYQMEATIEGCKSIKNVLLRFDFYLPYYNIYIEYDGEQHFREVKNWGGKEGLIERQMRDKIKNSFCKENNIKLFRIVYTDNIEEKLNFILSKFH